ncbi:MAG: indolepyruvate oxidoreductase subunit beta family protein [Pseudomonadota bacterium]
MSNKAQARQRITIAIAAMGGQGGGVLGDWIISLAEANGYYAQSTSVPGVAQRTGATVYYLELFPAQSELPVLALMPVPGDVDVVIAAELVEAGRAVQRGIVTPDRTTLVASNHRAYSYFEKSAMSDGRIDANELQSQLADTANRLVCFDMQGLAEQHGTVISATLFGALSGSGALPFSREQFEHAIRESGKAIDANLAAFAAAFAAAERHALDGTLGLPPHEQVDEPKPSSDRATKHFPPATQVTIAAALQRLVDYQDTDYAKSYLEMLNPMYQLDSRHGGETTNWALTNAVAKYLALWMSYEDTIRVADLKIRAARFERSREEVRASAEEIVYLTEFLHPRLEEVADTLPAGLGRWLLRTNNIKSWLSKFVLRERKINSAKISGFLLLYILAGMRRFRRSTLRYEVEQTRIRTWLQRISDAATQNMDLAVEITECQHLIKGYGDTHARGLKNYQRIMTYLDENPDCTANKIRALRTAALADEHGTQLSAAIQQAA